MKDQMTGRNLISAFMLLFFFYMVTSASHFGFFNKWGLREIYGDRSFEKVLDGSAQKPFVYRQFAPIIANFADSILPEDLKKSLVAKTPIYQFYSPKVAYSEKEGLAFRYRVVFALSFAGLFFALVLLRQVLINEGLGNTESIFAVTVFGLAFPYIETIGGYYYDSIELAFFALSCLLLQKKQYFLFLLIVVPATLNKESFLFFILALVPFIFCHEISKKTFFVLFTALLMAFLTNLYMKYVFSANSGGAVHFWLWRNLAGYLNPLTYIQRDWTYGTVSPRGASIFLLIPLLYMLKKSWLYIPGVFKFHAIMAALTNLPLALFFGHTGELRNLSFLHITSVVILATYIQYVMQNKIVKAHKP